eukprot:4282666-Amphidinium_carterae.1
MRERSMVTSMDSFETSSCTCTTMVAAEQRCCRLLNPLRPSGSGRYACAGGAHQVETILVIYALKLAFPNQVFLNRGNHEVVCALDETQNRFMGAHGFEKARSPHERCP